MAKAIKIVIVGDYNFTYNAHHATNLALEHSAHLLNIEIDYYWLRTHEAASLSVNRFTDFNGVIIAPGPYENDFFLNEIVKTVLSSQVALLTIGASFKIFLEVIIDLYKLNPNQEKVISSNMFQEEHFEKVEVNPISNSLKTLYNDQSRMEFTNAKFSIYPHALEILSKEIIDIEAENQFDEPEVISLKSRPFCVATMSLPQISSTREAPHPLISGFLNFANEWEQKMNRKKSG